MMAIETKTDPCIVVHLIERLEPGDRFPKTRAGWPLHITLLPWFETGPLQRAALIELLDEYAVAHSPFTVYVGNEKQFGADGETTVNVIDDQTYIRALRNGIKPIVTGNAGDFVKPDGPGGINHPYEAHITHHDVGGVVHRRNPGDVVPIEDFTLITYNTDAKGNKACQVICHFNLEGDEVPS